MNIIARYTIDFTCEQFEIIQILKKLVKIERFAPIRNLEMTFVIIDSKSIKKIHGSSVEVVNKSDLAQFKSIPKRWIAERTFAWIEKISKFLPQIYAVKE